MKYFRIHSFVWFDSGHAPMRQFTECLNYFTHFLREGRPRILRSILGLCIARGTQEMWYFWEMKSCSSSSPPQRVSSTSDMKMMENRALGVSLSVVLVLACSLPNVTHPRPTGVHSRCQASCRNRHLVFPNGQFQHHDSGPLAEQQCDRGTHQTL